MSSIKEKVLNSNVSYLEIAIDCKYIYCYYYYYFSYIYMHCIQLTLQPSCLLFGPN